MSLTIYIKGEDSYNRDKFECDVEALFKSISLVKNDFNIKVIEEIEQGTYNDEISFIDRFGFKLYLSNMSTGSKAAICVNTIQDKIINCVECGKNAINYIIDHCKSGFILVNRSQLLVEDCENIDVLLQGYHFTSANDLVTYLEEI